ncbi:thioredoxin domain-containing protein [Tenacibaculum jejuense]|nr:thioredoxin domain-containing protein [Tenacibaculum jejuense]
MKKPLLIISKICLIFILLIAFNCKSKEKNKITEKLEYTNALINESSPYLLQHAHNPVNWFPWDKQYLDQAKEENKLVLLSIGYASCHWCHVMEKETFEDKEVADFMNKNFINIKIDREEHPNVDKTYLKAVQIMTGNGGWPLNCVILPDGKPIWGGTYFNKENWLTSLKEIQRLYQENPGRAKGFANKLTEDLKSLQEFDNTNLNQEFSRDKLDNFIAEWKTKLDSINGGLIGKSQFPRASNYQFLLRYAYQKEDKKLENFVYKTLDKIANGGLNDHLAGGFARYTVDNKWHIPHFEKMLYDNAQLISLFSYAYQLTKNKQYKAVVYRTFDFIDKELYNDGLYFSSLNADSMNENGELEEGAYYTWKKEELQQLITSDFDLFKSYFGIDSIETVEGKHALVKIYNDEVFSKKHQLSLDDVKLKINSWTSTLLNARNKRIKPTTDQKILTSWNALLLQSFVDAYKVFGDDKFKTKALECAETIKRKAISNTGEITRSITTSNKDIKGYLEDYALLAQSFISLYEIYLDEKWLQEAKKITEISFTNFFNTEIGFFNYTAKNSDQLISDNFEIEDLVIPSSNSVICKNLFKLGHYFSNDNYLDLSEKMLQKMLPKIEKHPHVYSNWIDTYLNLSYPFYETAISGKNAIEKLKKLNQNYIPNHLIIGSTENSDLPLLKGKYNNDKTLIYICMNKTCKLPTENINTAVSMLKKN